MREIEMQLEGERGRLGEGEEANTTLPSSHFPNLSLLITT